MLRLALLRDAVRAYGRHGTRWPGWPGPLDEMLAFVGAAERPRAG